MVVDILFLVFAGVGFFIGYKKGIIRTVLMTFSIIAGLIIAFRFSPPVTEFLIQTLENSGSHMILIGFAVTFILTIFAIRGIVKLVENALDTANINFINQIAGGILIASITTLMLSGLIYFGESANVMKEEWKSDSITYSSLVAFPGVVKSYAEQIKPMAEDFIEYSKQKMDETKPQSSS